MIMSSNGKSSGNVYGMHQKLCTILVSFTVFLGMAAGDACAAFSPRSGHTPCEKSRSYYHGITKATATGSCHMLPCRASKGHFFILPDPFSRLPRTEKRYIFSVPGIQVLAEIRASLRNFQAGKVLLKMPSSFIPPPLFSIHCSFIC